MRIKILSEAHAVTSPVLSQTFRDRSVDARNRISRIYASREFDGH